MTTDGNEGSQWAIELIAPDDAGGDFYLREYKPFRLSALQRDPDAFGSTYAREIAFSDQDWLNRLHKPIAKTFVVVRLRDRRILAATSLFGPIPGSQLVANPHVANPAAGGTPTGANGPLLYQLTGVYTRAEARSQGLGRAVVKVAIDQAYEEARQQARELQLGVDVYTTNAVAISFYEKSGFIVSGPRPVDEDTDAARPELIMLYHERKANS